MHSNELQIQRLSDALHESEQRYRIVTDAANDAIITIDESGIITSVNPAVEKLFGYPPLDLLGKKSTILIPERLRHNYLAAFERHLAAKDNRVSGNPIELSALHKHGHEILVTASIGQSQQENQYFFTGVIHDIEKHGNEEALLIGQNQLLEQIATGVPVEKVLTDLITLIESQCDNMYGSILLLENDGVHIRHGAGPRLPTAYIEGVNGQSIGPCAGSCGTAMYLRKRVIVEDILRDPLWADYQELAQRSGFRACWSTPIISPQQKALGSFAMYYRETRSPKPEELRLSHLASHIAGIAIERKQAEDHINHMAHHDALTGLPNRVSLQINVSEAIAQARRREHLVALLFIDLDNFKNINDSLGHRIGDLLLQAVATRLRGCLRQGENISRLGGDEFVVTLPMSTSSHEAALVASKLLKALEQPFVICGSELHAASSIGISLYPTDGDNVEMLMQAADTAMYHAKQKGRGNYQFYTNSLNVAIQHRLAIERQLRHALSRNEFTLHYQPLINMQKNCIIAAEALIRWQPPTGEAILPSEFIPIAEETGLILPIGEWVLREACAQLKRWHIAGHLDMKIAVNLSVRQLFQIGFSDIVAQILSTADVPAASLELEITESVMMVPSEENLTMLKQLSNMGIRLSVDDFGTGYSSLSYLQRYPVYTLKIDRSFVCRIGENRNDTTITVAIIAMGKSLQMNVIAEGVETAEQATFLKEHGCVFAQGNFYSEPLEADAFAALIAS
ncbi:MAG: EAL domain-containing protein [Pseudomonadota bacterium]